MRHFLTICTIAAGGLWWLGSETLLQRSWAERPTVTGPEVTGADPAISRGPARRVAESPIPLVAETPPPIAISQFVGNWAKQELQSRLGLIAISGRIVDRAHVGAGLLLAPLWLAADAQPVGPSLAGDAPHPAHVHLVAAETQPTPASALATAISAANNGYRPASPEVLDAARQQLDLKLAALDKFLSGDAASAQGWKEYLHWTELEAELQRGSSAKMETLRDTAARLSDFHGGDAALADLQAVRKALGLEQFRDVRSALIRYANLLGESQKADGAKVYQQRLDALATAVGKYQQSHSRQDADAISAILGQLEATGQAADLMREIHTQLDHPNLYVRASKDFIATITGDRIDQPNPLSDWIEGTQIVGTTRTVGRRFARLVPNDDRAVLEVTLDATAHSTATGYHPPVTVQSHGTTVIHGVKRVTIDADGYTSAGPSCSTATTHTDIDSICVCAGRLVTKIATKKVYKKLPEAECIASEHAQARVNEQMESAAIEYLAKQNANWHEKLRDPLMMRDAFPEQLRYATTSDALTVTALQAGPRHVAAPSAPPEITGDPLIALRVHESFINNLTAATLSDRTINKEEFDSAQLDLFGELRPETQPDNDKEESSWTIRFAKERPVTVVFDNSGFEITLRGAKFTSERLGASGAGPMNITAKYKIEQGADAKVAKRIGDVVVESPGGAGGGLTLSKRRIVHDRFARIFKPEIKLEGLTFSSEPWSKAGKLISSQLSSDQGWLVIGWVSAGETTKK